MSSRAARKTHQVCRHALAFVRCAELITSSAGAVEIKIRPRRICPGCEVDLPALRRLSRSLAFANVLSTFSAFVAFHHYSKFQVVTRLGGAACKKSCAVCRVPIIGADTGALPPYLDRQRC